MQRGPRKGQRRLPESQRRRILRDHPFCALALPGICTGRSEEVHHVIDAQDGGGDDDANLTGVCRACHRRHSARRAQQRATASAWDWKRRPEQRPDRD